MKVRIPLSTVADVRQRGCGHRVAYPAAANLNELSDSVHDLCPRFRLQPQLDKLANGLGADEIMSLLGLGPVIKARLSVTRILFTPAKKSFRVHAGRGAVKAVREGRSRQGSCMVVADTSRAVRGSGRPRPVPKISAPCVGNRTATSAVRGRCSCSPCRLASGGGSWPSLKRYALCRPVWDFWL